MSITKGGGFFGELAELVEAYSFPVGNVELFDLPQGADNLNVGLSVRGDRFVLRCYRITPKEEVEYELDLIAALSDKGFPTPRVFRRRDGIVSSCVAGIPCALFEFVEGKRIDERDPSSGLRVAELLGRFSQVTAGEVFHGRRTRTDLGRLEDLETLCGRAPGFLAIEGMDVFLERAKAVVAEFNQCVAKRREELPWGAVHHDVNAGNILTDAEGRIVALLDFDEAHDSFLLFDIAGLIHYWARDKERRVDLEKSRRLVEAYDAVRVLTMSERELLGLATLIFFAADAAGYLMGNFERRSGPFKAWDCNSLVAFHAMYEDPRFRDFGLL
jgi:homoserine kinase type II